MDQYNPLTRVFERVKLKLKRQIYGKEKEEKMWL